MCRLTPALVYLRVSLQLARSLSVSPVNSPGVLLSHHRTRQHGTWGQFFFWAAAGTHIRGLMGRSDVSDCGVYTSTGHSHRIKHFSVGLVGQGVSGATMVLGRIGRVCRAQHDRWCRQMAGGCIGM